MEGWEESGGGQPPGDSAGRGWLGCRWGENGVKKPGRTWRMAKTSERWVGAAWPYQVPCTQHPSRPQCATHKLCHPEELVLLGHSLGIPQAPLSRCSSQALQLVSVWRGGGR